MSFRIAVFTAGLAPHVTRTIGKLLADSDDVEIRVLHHAPQRMAKRLLRNQWRNLKRHGWRWVPYQASDVIGRIKARPRADRGLSHPRLTVEYVPSVNAPEVVERLRAWAPDLGLSLAAPILKAQLFETPRLGTLNIHKGKLPDYRGMPPAFWELWHGESEVGVTVHKVEAGLDTGPVLLAETVPVEKYSTPAGLRVRLDELGVRLIVEGVRRMRDGSATFTPQPAGGRTFTRPTLAQEAELATRHGRDVKRQAKNAVFNIYGTLGRLSPAARDRVLVLLYHRVSDAFRDAVTVGVEGFDTQMRWLADHCNVVPLESLLAGELPKDGPVVAVTFDDGYLDNYENAAPILLKHAVPATFFVSTDHVANNAPFAHDLAKLGTGLPNMNWDQIREMKAEGLSFGSHTANHVNLARTDADKAREELARSKAALETELGLDRVMFAYPFGKRRDFTPERLMQVKAAGYVCNCSAYGGENDRHSFDKWDIRRQGIDHNFDVPAIRAKLAGWKARSYV